MLSYRRSSVRIKVTTAVFSLVFLSACAFGPDHEKPIVAIPQNILGKGDLDHKREVDWWTRAGDQDLIMLIDLVLTDNLSLKMALARIDAAQAQAAIARSTLFPNASYSGSFMTNKGPSAFGPAPATFNGQLAPTLTWSPDFWGRTRRQVEAAKAMVKSQEEDFRAATVLIVGQVAGTYLQLRAAEEQLNSTRVFLTRLRSELQEIKKKTPPPPVTMISPLEAFLFQLEASIPTLLGSIEDSENSIRALSARPVLRLRKGVALSKFRTPVIPRELSSALLFRRPDVIQAEHILIAQNASVGAAMAAYLPQLSLSLAGGGGLSGLASGAVPSAAGTAINATAGLLGPIFNAGAIDAGVSAANSAKKEAVLNYRKTVINAYLEARTAIVRYNASGKAVAAYRKALNATLVAEAHVKALSDKDPGQIGALLALQQQEFAGRQALIGARLAQFNALINVYKSLGGPWIDVWARRSLESEKFGAGQAKN